MRGAYFQYLKSKGQCSCKTDAVESAAARHKEEAELRLARIQNGVHPDYQNGKTLTGCPDSQPGQLKQD
jgi:hypothetical protein